MTIIIFVAAAIVAAFALQRYILTNTLNNVTYRSRSSKDVVEPDESFELITEIRNNKWMPELYIRVSERLPAEATGFPGDDKEPWNRMTLYLRPYQKVTSTMPLALTKRGRYVSTGAMLTGGDFFGTKTKIRIYSQQREIIVVPRRIDSPGLDKMLGGFLGDLSVRRFILPDPVLTIGVREYTGREPQKDISWAHSARAGQLLVKRYDHTLELAATVILNLRAPNDNKVSKEDFEECLSLCRMVCEELERKGVKYSFSTNAAAVGSYRLTGGGLPDGLGRAHLMAVLEWLGRSSSFGVQEGFPALLHKALRRAEQGRVHIVITPEAPDSAAYALLERLRVITGGDALVITPKQAVGREVV